MAAKKPPHYGVYTRLAPSGLHGIGVFAIKPVPKGTYIFYGDDAPLAWLEKIKIQKLPPEIKKLYMDFCVRRGTKYGCPKNFNQLTVPWYLNHSKHPNVGCDKKYNFFTLRNIRKGEELLADYSTYSST